MKTINANRAGARASGPSTEKTGTGLWRDGEIAELVVERFDGRDVVIIRRDTMDSYLGLTGIYTGRLSGNRIEGDVTWFWEGRPDDKPQTGKWYALIRDDRESTCLPDEKTDCAAVPGHAQAPVSPLRAVDYFKALKDMEQVFCWTKIAAIEDYDLEGASLLALMYGGGSGTLQDLTKAAEWAHITSQRGYLPNGVQRALSGPGGRDPDSTLSACRAEFFSSGLTGDAGRFEDDD